MTKNDFFDASDDILEMNPNPDDFYNVLNLYQDDPLDDPEDFLEMNVNLDTMVDDHVIDLFEMNKSNFFLDAFEIEEIGFLNTFVLRKFLLRIIFEVFFRGH